MQIYILTLFPEVFDPILNSSILSRAQKKGLVNFHLVDIRQFGEGKHKVVDDRPYGGGAGMILKPDVLSRALESVLKQLKIKNLQAKLASFSCKFKIILTSASGYPYTQTKALELSKLDNLIIICGHYEGVDQRFIDRYVDEEVSIGDYVLTGGEIPAMMIADSVVRLIPQVLQKEEATLEESFTQNLLEYPHYTRPEVFEGESAPQVLLSGNHQKIAQWRREKALEKTKKIRPDLHHSKGSCLPKSSD